MPDERRPPDVARHANALQAENAQRRFDEEDSLAVLARDHAFREQHTAMLPHVPHRQRGEFDPDRVLAEAKIIDAETLDEASHWLRPKERMIVLHDRALLNLAMGLKPRPTLVVADATKGETEVPMQASAAVN
jgi:membrane glycosyltransferase